MKFKRWEIHIKPETTQNKFTLTLSMSKQTDCPYCAYIFYPHCTLCLVYIAASTLSDCTLHLVHSAPSILSTLPPPSCPLCPLHLVHTQHPHPVRSSLSILFMLHPRLVLSALCILKCINSTVAPRLHLLEVVCYLGLSQLDTHTRII